MKTMFTSKTRSAFIFLELILLAMMVGLLANEARPNSRCPRAAARLNSLYSNLPANEHAKERWGMGG